MECVISLERLAESQHGQLKYASAFVDEHIRDIRIEDGHIRIEHDSPAGNEVIAERVNRLVDRFSKGDFGFKENILFEHRVSTPYQGDIITELVTRKNIKVLEPGLFIFREPFSTLMRFLDYSFVNKIAQRFEGLQEESYPAVIHTETLNKTNHFTSFPEHIHFLTHLREDLDVIEGFSQSIRDAGGWKQDQPLDLDRHMPKPNFTMNPSTCYHCYEGLQDETLEGEGIVVTAISKCHRFESKNHSDFGRLLDFSMREIIFVGKPDFVKENRLKSIEYLKELAMEWKVDSFMEIANDPFFTNDFQTKASFQRNQEMKYELRLTVPYQNKSIACSSVNFHSNTFGNAFNIKMGKRNAVTGCVGFGIERWAFAFLAQYGLDDQQWPAAFREQYADWQAKSL
ncbi:aminoacyl--tRNA ligase-related protein [Paenibacillus sp. GP183]|uniref:aminoacyl--tRNA ligase-related protein n=1 Tax=Paenibacillus sp. GP183 TaxID=1882751 RepID=UPI000896C342|nr:aminoacyl--tRNA ligase-related protein [Paenibacillus sp. GP183]SEC35758.1 Seryl-tRNA synthetase [Paenibacillus sp. GP183]